MHILHVSAECYPAAKVGGLGDVAGALPKYLNKSGAATASVVIPHYHNKFFREHHWEKVAGGTFNLGTIEYRYNILKEQTAVLGFDLFITEIPGLLDEELPYGYSNDMRRHLGFQICVVDWISHQDHKPDVVHCHDHPTALIPFMVDYCHNYRHLGEIKTVFTIHSAQYQGQFGLDKTYLIPPYDEWKQGMLEWSNQVNPLACAIKCCWKFTTVSPSYLKELQQNALGIEKLITDEQQKSQGILNGIDADVWNAETDLWIEKTYDATTVTEGKMANKRALCNSFRLNPQLPLIVFIGRLVGDKGGDLLADAIRQTVMRLNREVNFLVLGSGVNEYEDALNALKADLPDNFNCYIGYHEKLAHLIYAGADFLLMPSRVEPCGLNQLYALRYGTIPVVRSTGGLIDTVTDISERDGFGIRFEQATVASIDLAVERALALYKNATEMERVKKRIMKFDHSWDHAAGVYLELYRSMGG